MSNEIEALKKQIETLKIEKESSENELRLKKQKVVYYSRRSSMKDKILAEKAKVNGITVTEEELDERMKTLGWNILTKSRVN